MKYKSTILLLIAFTALAIVLNIFSLKIGWFVYTGIYCIFILFAFVIINFASKLIKRKRKIKGEENAFIFPDGIAKKMKEVDIGIQYESSVIALAFLILGMIGLSIYMVFFTSFDFWFLTLFVINSICGLILMGSMLITNYQQLISYRESTKFIRSNAAKFESPGPTPPTSPISPTHSTHPVVLPIWEKPRPKTRQERTGLQPRPHPQYQTQPNPSVPQPRYFNQEFQQNSQNPQQQDIYTSNPSGYRVRRRRSTW